MKERKQYPKEFKQGAVRMVTDQGRSVADAGKWRSGCACGCSLSLNGDHHPMRLTKSYYDEPARTTPANALGLARSPELGPP